MSEFRFETDCSLGKGWYCYVTKVFFDDDMRDAEQKARDWVATLDEKDKRIEELEGDCTHYREEQLSAAKLFRAGSDKIKDLQACIDEAVRRLKRPRKNSVKALGIIIPKYVREALEILTGKTEKEEAK